MEKSGKISEEEATKNTIKLVIFVNGYIWQFCSYGSERKL